MPIRIENEKYIPQQMLTSVPHQSIEYCVLPMLRVAQIIVSYIKMLVAQIQQKDLDKCK